MEFDVERLLAHRGYVERLARRLVGDETSADDVVQDTWVRALRSRPDTSRPLRAWLASVVRSSAFDRHRRDERRRAREGRLAPPDPPRTPEEVLAREAAREAVVQSVRKLPDKYRSVILLHYFDDRSVAEISVQLDLPPETVKTRLRRARERLREHLDRDHSADGHRWRIALLPLALPRSSPAVAASTLPSMPTIGAFVMSWKQTIAAALLLVAALYWIIGPKFGGSPDVEEPSRSRELAAAESPRTSESTESGESDTPSEVESASPLDRTIRVVDRRDGAPVVSAVLTWVDWDERREAGRTGTDGTIELSLERRTSTHLLVEHPLFVDREIDGTRIPLVIELERGRTVRGHVVTELGAPIEGARVAVVFDPVIERPGRGRIDRRRASRVVAKPDRFHTVKTNAKGEFEARIDTRTVAFQAAHPEFAPGATLSFRVPDDGLDDVEIVLRPGHTLEGRVVSTDGSPVGGARVFCTALPALDGSDPVDEFCLRPETTADADGHFVLAGLGEEYDRAFAAHPDYWSTISVGPFLERRTKDFIVLELRPACWLEGRIVDAREGHHRVDLDRRRGPELEVADDGRFRSGPIVNIAPGTRGRISSYQGRSEWFELPDAWTGGHDIGDVTLEPWPSVEVTVHDDRGAPIVGARVEAFAADSVPRDDRAWSFHFGITHDDGTTPVTLPTASDVVLWVVDPRVEVASTTVADGSMPVTITCVRRGAIEGRLLGSGGEPIANARIRYAPPAECRRHERFIECVSAPDGSFRIETLPPALPIALEIIAESLGVDTHLVAPLEPGETRSVGDLQVSPGTTLAGRVVDGSGHPVPGVPVLLTHEQQEAWTTSDDQGDFTFPRAPESSVRLLAIAPDGRRSQSESVRASGEGSSVELVLREFEDYTGSIVDAGGQPIAGARVSISRQGTAISDESGRFSLLEVPVGEVSLTVRAEGYPSFERSVASLAELPRPIVLNRGATLVARLHDAAGVVSGRAHFTLHGEQGYHSKTLNPEPDGTYVWSGLQPGSATVTARVSDARRAPPTPVTLHAGETATVELELPSPNPAITFIIRDPEGNPLPDVDAFFHSPGGKFNDESGRDGVIHRAEGVPARTSVVFRHERFEFAPLRLDDVDRLAGPDPIEVTLDRATTWHLQVLDDDGNRIPDVDVKIESSLLPGRPREVELPTGAGEVTGIGIDIHGVEVRRNGERLSKHIVEVTRHETRDVTLRVTEPYRVEGRVFAKGTVARGGTLHFAGIASVQVSEEGEYSVGLPREGRWAVTYRNGTERLHGQFTLREKSSDLAFESRAVTLTLLDPAGRPASSLPFFLSALGTGSIRLETDADGRARLDGLTPGLYSVYLTQPAERWAGGAPFELGHESETVVSLVATDALVITTRSERSDRQRLFVVRARIRQSVATDPTAANAYLWPRGASHGVLEVEGFAPAPFEVRFDESGPTVEPIELTPGEELVLGIVDSIGVGVADAPYTLSRVDGEEWTRELVADFDGTHRVWLAPGRYRLRVFGVEREFDVETGTRPRVVVEVRE